MNSFKRVSLAVVSLAPMLLGVGGEGDDNVTEGAGVDIVFDLDPLGFAYRSK